MIQPSFADVTRPYGEEAGGHFGTCQPTAAHVAMFVRETETQSKHSIEMKVDREKHSRPSTVGRTCVGVWGP